MTDPLESLPPDVVASIKQQFQQECDEHVAALEAGLLELQRGAKDSEIINMLFRNAHSIKGGAATFGMKAPVALAHKLESALSIYRSSQSIPNEAAILLFLRAVDRLSDLINAERAGAAVDLHPGDDVLIALERFAIEGETKLQDDLDHFVPLPVSFADLESPARTWTIRLKPFRELYARANDPLVLFKELATLGEMKVVLDDAALPLLADMDPNESYLSWTIALSSDEGEARIRDVFEFVEGDCELEICPEQAVKPEDANVDRVVPKDRELPSLARSSTAAMQTIRVNVERVDRLVNLIGELVISESALLECLSSGGAARNVRAADALEHLQMLTRDLQDGVMAIRAQPIKTVFQRLPRLVRELEVSTGKRVDLLFDGEDTELDRTVIEGLIDPLSHLIRNAVDHGIEFVPDRSKSKKSEAGNVRIAAAHRAGRVIIEVSDDGQGIDRERVLAMAIERGLVDQETDLEAEEIDALIFHPGFSTSRVVTDISGRGVGMDVVKRAIQALGGRVAIASHPGKGTTITLSLPLTLAVLDGMLVKTGGQQLVIPLSALLETVQLTPKNLRKFGAEANILTVRGSHVPLIDLAAKLGFRNTVVESDVGIALVVEDDSGQRLAMMIDEIQGQRQVVIKALESNYHAVHGIAAATILGDGNVALIVDVNAFTQLRKGKAPESMAANG